MEKIKVFTAFSGYDSQCMALRNIGVPYKVVGWAEIDKYAIQAHDVIFPNEADKNFGNVTKIDWENVPDFDLFTYSFPCQDISGAGKQKGLDKDSDTRSSLLWECEKAIKAKRPKYLLMENVKNLVSKKFINHFLEWDNLLRGLGYTNFSQVLNAKHYGVPQNRERVFMISVLGDAWYNFPQKIRLTKCIRDILEDNVPEKYYLSQTLIDGFIEHERKAKEKGNGFRFNVSDGNKIATTITTQEGCRSHNNFIQVPYNTIMVLGEVTKDSQAGKVYSSDGVMATVTSGTHGYSLGYVALPSNNIQVVGNLQIEGWSESMSRVYSDNGISPTINTCAGGNLQPKILQLNNSLESGGKQPYQQNRIYDVNGLLPAIGTCNAGNIIETSILQRGRGKNKGGSHKICPTITSNAFEQNNFVCDDRIRRLTPRECFRLMGVSEQDIDTIQSAGISDTQQYKMAGNSIVVPVLELIFRNMFN